MSNDNRPTLTRRQFLKGGAMGASAVALPYFFPASVLGRDGAVAPSERIVMGGIGIGGRGSYDLSVVLSMRDVQWVAICDVMKRQRQAAKNMVDSKQGNQDCAVYSDMRQFLAERTDVDGGTVSNTD